MLCDCVSLSFNNGSAPEIVNIQWCCFVRAYFAASREFSIVSSCVFFFSSHSFRLTVTKIDAQTRLCYIYFHPIHFVKHATKSNALIFISFWKAKMTERLWEWEIERKIDDVSCDKMWQWFHSICKSNDDEPMSMMTTTKEKKRRINTTINVERREKSDCEYDFENAWIWRNYIYIDNCISNNGKSSNASQTRFT